MNKLNVVIFYQTGIELRSITEVVTGEPPVDTILKLSGLQMWLVRFLVESSKLAMPNARPAADALLRLVTIVNERMLRAVRENNEEAVTTDENTTLRRALEIFDSELEHDAREMNIFSVADKGTHSTSKLLDTADLNLAVDVRSRLSNETINDVKAAGRCLAFDTPTASAFHILRAVEPLILQYRNTLIGTTLKPKSRNWGAYIRELAGHGGDPRVIGMLNHIKDFYRNPIMHPEQSLTPDQALSLFHACLSVIVQLDGAIRTLSTPTTSGTSVSPGPTP